MGRRGSSWRRRRDDAEAVRDVAVREFELAGRSHTRSRALRRRAQRLGGRELHLDLGDLVEEVRQHVQRDVGHDLGDLPVSKAGIPHGADLVVADRARVSRIARTNLNAASALASEDRPRRLAMMASSDRLFAFFPT